MVSLNLLEGTAPLARERKGGVSKRFLITTGILTGVMVVSLFFLEVIFAAFGLGEGTVFFKPDTGNLRVSQDEFDVINREKATAQALFFDKLKEVTSGGAKYSLIMLTNSSQILVKGSVNSEADANYMFDIMRGLDQWNLIAHQVFDKQRTKPGKREFMYKAEYLATPDPQMDFNSPKDLPTLESLNPIVEDVRDLVDELEMSFDRRPTIERTITDGSLNEYVYTMETKSSIAALDSFFKTLYDEKTPIIFDRVELRPAAPLYTAKFTFRILIQK